MRVSARDGSGASRTRSHLETSTNAIDRGFFAADLLATPRRGATFGGVDLFDASEPVLHEGPANYFRGLITVGGTLYLTARRLRFRSHELNVGDYDESIPLESVERVRAVRTAIVIPNGVVVKTYDGREERFLVWGRSLWMERIEQACASKGYR